MLRFNIYVQKVTRLIEAGGFFELESRVKNQELRLIGIKKIDQLSKRSQSLFLILGS
jgi:hypothetical protein